MKRIFISAILAASMLATTGAYAQSQPVVQEIQYKHNDQRDRANKRDNRVNERVVIKKKVVVKKQRWGKGQRMSDWRQRQAIRDYNRYGLRKPGRNQQWVKVDNTYILVSVTSGIIAGILAGR